MAGNGASPGAMKSAGGLLSSSDFHHDARFLSTSPYGMQLPGSRPVTEVPDASLDRFYLFIIILIGNVPAQQERRLLLPPRVFSSPLKPELLGCETALYLTQGESDPIFLYSSPRC